MKSIRKRTDERNVHTLLRRTGFHGNGEPSRKNKMDKGITDGWTWTWKYHKTKY